MFNDNDTGTVETPAGNVLSVEWPRADHTPSQVLTLPLPLLTVLLTLREAAPKLCLLIFRILGSICNQLHENFQHGVHTVSDGEHLDKEEGARIKKTGRPFSREPWSCLGMSVRFPPSVLEPCLARTRAGRVCAATVSVSSYETLL